MDGEGAHIVGEIAVGGYEDFLDGFCHVGDYAAAAFEILIDVELLVGGELLVCGCDALDAVEGVVAVLSVLLVLGHHVPSATAYFEGVGFDLRA